MKVYQPHSLDEPHNIFFFHFTIITLPFVTLLLVEYLPLKEHRASQANPSKALGVEKNKV